MPTSVGSMTATELGPRDLANFAATEHPPAPPPITTSLKRFSFLLEVEKLLRRMRQEAGLTRPPLLRSNFGAAFIFVHLSKGVDVKIT